MDLTKIIAGVKTAAAALGLTNAEDVGKLLVAFIQALPAIEKGILSAEPFILAGVELIKNGGAPTDQQWAEQLERLAANSKVLEDTVAADDEGLIP